MFKAFLILLLMTISFGQANANEPTKIAVVLNPDGKYTHIQKPIYRGIKLFLKDKKDIELVLLKASDDLAGQMKAAKQVVDKKINYVIGHNFSSLSKAFLTAVPKEHELTYVTPLATSLELTTIRPGVFISWPSNDLQVKAISKFMTSKDLTDKKVVMLVNESEPYAVGMADKFSASLSKISRNSASKVFYLKGEENLGKKVEEVLKLQPEVIFIPSYSYELYIIYSHILPRLKNLKKLPYIISGDSVGKETNLFEKLGDLKHLINDRFYFTNGWHPSVATPENKKFAKAYSAEYKEPATNGSVSGYEAAKILYEALQMPGQKKPSVTNKAMQSLSTNLTVGKVSLDKDQTVIRPVVLIQITEKGFKYHGTY